MVSGIQEQAWSKRDMILVVDDDDSFREGMRIALQERDGFQVATAADVESAMAVLERERIGLILSDIRMPGRNGYDLLRLVRQCPQWCGIPFIFVAAVVDGEAAVRADAHVVKPFEMDDLMAKIEAFHSPRYLGWQRKTEGQDGTAQGAGIGSREGR